VPPLIFMILLYSTCTLHVDLHVEETVLPHVSVEKPPLVVRGRNVVCGLTDSWSALGVQTLPQAFTDTLMRGSPQRGREASLCACHDTRLVVSPRKTMAVTSPRPLIPFWPRGPLGVDPWTLFLTSGLLFLGMFMLFRLSSIIAAAFFNHCDGATALAKAPGSKYKDKVVWVTGASSGLGRELARQLARLGAKLILSARSTSTLEEVKQELLTLGAASKDICALPIDMAELEELPAATRKAMAAFGGIDIMINNAGLSQRELGCNTGFDVDLYLTKVNFLGPACVAKAVLPSMVSRGGGTFINISSLAGKFGVPLRTAYCGSKHAILGFFDALRLEEHARGTNIHVTNVCPGSVRTNIARNAMLGNGSPRGQSDVNIDNGLNPVWACSRILAAAASQVDECWLAAGQEMLLAYLSQYAPGLCKAALRVFSKKKIAATLAPVEKAPIGKASPSRSRANSSPARRGRRHA
jgi:short-subunit dehydrogenase